MMICLAITCVLIVAMFIYFRERMRSCDQKILLLSDLVHHMAGITKATLDDKSDKSVESCESASEASESEASSEESIASVKSHESKHENHELVNELVCELCDVFEKTSVSDDEIVVKKIDVDLYNSLTVKELKERVALVDGPKLKTKKELVDFLKSVEVTEIKSNI